MKAILIPAMLIAAMPALRAQPKSDDNTAKTREILKIEQSLQDAVAVGNKALWAKYLAPDYLVVNEDGSRDNRASFLEKLHPLPKGFSGHINVINPHINFRGNIAIVNFVADEYETAYNQQLHTTYGIMDTYEQTKTGWQISNCLVFEIPQLPPNPAHVDKAVLQQYCGTYYILPDVSYTVSLQGDKLFGQMKGRDKEELLPETNTVFFRKSDTRGRRIFYKTPQSIWKMAARRNGQDLVWTKK
ncbi:MAG: nuclear transport factor 2 family protein [Bacteroidota bacterium]